MKKAGNTLGTLTPKNVNQSIRVEKISNGYLVHHSQDGPKGFQTKTVHYPTLPKIAVGTPSKSKKGK